jgi:long-chain acyl-CoA synthetase
MIAGRPFAWEKSYPDGIAWDTPIETTTIPALLDRSVVRFAGKPAIEFRERRITYSELGRLADRAAAGFIKLGVTRGTPIGLYLPNSPHYLVSFFGALRAGARIVQLSPLDAEREVAHKLKDSGARIVVTVNVEPMLPMALKLHDAGLIDTLVVADDAACGPSGNTLLALPDGPRCVPLARVMETERPVNWPALSKDDIAVLQYTGGTTGIPKGAMLTHANITASCSIYDVWFNPQSSLKPGEARAIMALPLFHIFGLSTVTLRHLSNGNEVLLREKFDADAVLDDIEKKRATHMNGVPTMWLALCHHPGIATRDLSSLLNCSCGGAALPVEIAERFEALTGKKLRSGIGMTETSPAACTQPIRLPGKTGSCGVPLPGIVVKIVALDDPSRELGLNETGEICIKGPNVTAGYWNRPEESAQAFIDGYFHSGDIGYMDDDGYLWVVDRKKDMIISGGFNVYPRVIEDAIFEHPDVEEAMVVGIPHEYRGEAAKAFVKMRPGAPPLTLDSLRNFLADKIGRHEMPAALELRDTLPRTSVGKPAKMVLTDEERCMYEAARAGALPKAG